MKLTPFGKYVRKLRIDAGMRLKDMADMCEVSASFLSSMETGRKEIPDDIASKIASVMNLDEHDEQELYRATEQSKSYFTLTMDGDDLTRSLAGAFARNFSSISEDKKKEILNLLKS